MEINPVQPWIIDILSQVHTTSEADHFLSQITALSESLFNNKTLFKEKLEELFPSELSISIMNGIRESGFNLDNSIELQHYFENITNFVKQAPVINITIAFRPKQKTTQKIYDWISLRLKRPVLLNIKVEKQIIGGAIIEFNGKYLEYTIHRTLNEIIIPGLKKQQTDISKIQNNNGKLH